ncbi:MAG TPA: diaminopimelate epimerase [Rhizomicrobium sp.]|nr:diaminopimelate epimerase [Rhizomicrobium sp.]
MTAFLKMHGLGNDFVVFDARKSPVSLDRAQARAIADRRLGIGCDQVIVIEGARNGANVAMRIFNSDGGEVESCGNAARCVAQLLFNESGRDSISMETAGGALVCRANGASVTVDMGTPSFDWRAIPLREEVETKSFALEIAGIDLPALKSVSALSVGNPHCVLFVDEQGLGLAQSLGPIIEHHPMFPERTNVEFVHVLTPNRIRMRVWERGVGVTMACGTGACAAAVAAHRRGLAAARTDVILDGGTLTIEWNGGDAPVFMTGPTALSYRGDIDLEALTR